MLAKHLGDPELRTFASCLNAHFFYTSIVNMSAYVIIRNAYAVKKKKQDSNVSNRPLKAQSEHRTSPAYLFVCSCMSKLSNCLGKEKESGVSDICSLTSSHL